MGSDVGKLGAQAPVNGKAGGDDQKVQHKYAAWRADVQLVADLLHFLHCAAKVEEGVGMARDAQRAAVRRRHLLGVDVVANAPFPLVRQQVLAVSQAGHARALGFVDAWQLAAANQHVDAGGAVLQRGGSTVHGRGACADDGYMLASQRGVVHLVGRVSPEFLVHALHEGWNLRAAQAIAARGQHQAAGLPGADLALGLDIDFHYAVGLGANGHDFMAVAYIGLRDAAVPAQIVHPLQTGDFVQRRPALHSKLGNEPGAKAQRGNAQRRAGQLFGRAQGFHARGGSPGAFKVQRGFIQQHGLDTDMGQRGCQRQTTLASTNHQHIVHGLAVARGGRNPGLGGPAQRQQIVAQAFFQRGQASRGRGGQSIQRHKQTTKAPAACGWQTQ